MAAIFGSSWLRASQIDVTTNKGIVVLSSTVDSEQNIAKGIEVASSQKNVKAVETNLRVRVFPESKKMVTLRFITGLGVILLPPAITHATPVDAPTLPVMPLAFLNII